jgi:hypothetical protein
MILTTTAPHTRLCETLMAFTYVPVPLIVVSIKNTPGMTWRTTLCHGRLRTISAFAPIRCVPLSLAQEWLLNLSPQESLQRISTELYDTVTLRALGLCVNQRFSLLICVPCGVVLVPSQGASHLAQKHSLRCAELCRIIAPYSLLSSIPPAMNGAIRPIEGLPVVDAFKCTDCGYILSTTRHLNTHFSEKHPHNTRPDRYAPISAQHLNNFSSKNYFEVSIPMSATTPLTIDDYIANVTKEMNLVHTTLSVQPDARNIPQWLQITGWHEHLAGHIPKNLRQLVSFPTVAEFPTLKKYVAQLLHDCCALIKETPVLVLQKLNSPDMAKR